MPSSLGESRVIGVNRRGQPYGDKARQELSRLVFGKAVKVETTGKDR